MEVQHFANNFNKLYIKATRTSQPQDYFKAALAARMLVGSMDNYGIIVDNFDKELIEQEGDIFDE